MSRSGRNLSCQTTEPVRAGGGSAPVREDDEAGHDQLLRLRQAEALEDHRQDARQEDDLDRSRKGDRPGQPELAAGQLLRQGPPRPGRQRAQSDLAEDKDGKHAGVGLLA